ncbi:MAG: CPBP family intramembrane metalloprotease [Bacteroidetes bacterium]|nr:CPBP family intramembrane metalloprotease [Bacteroidota bacterium]
MNFLKSELKLLLKLITELNTKVVILFITSALLLIASHYSAAYYIPSEIAKNIPFINGIRKDFREYILWFTSDIFILLVIPLLIIKFFFKEKIRDYGIQFGASSIGLKYCLLFIIPMIVIIWFVSGSENITNYYPTLKSAVYSWQLFIAFQSSLLIYMIAWEFFWRGFLFFGLEEKFGIYAILIQMIPFVLLHQGKPFIESVGAVFGGIALGYLAYRTRSIWYGIIIHFVVITFMDFISIIRIRSSDFGVEFRTLTEFISDLFL